MEEEQKQKCQHEKYGVRTKMENVELKALKTFQMIVRVEVYCANCKSKFTFHARPGFSTQEPSVNVDCSEIRIPVEWPEIEKETTLLPPPEGFLQ